MVIIAVLGTFGVAKGTVCVIVNDVCQAIVKVLLSKYVKFPSGEGIVEVVSGFESRYGFPQCIGAVDGTHIPILAPEECAKDTTIERAIIPLSCKLLLITAIASLTSTFGWPGSVHDAQNYM